MNEYRSCDKCQSLTWRDSLKYFEFDYKSVYKFFLCKKCAYELKELIVKFIKK